MYKAFRNVFSILCFLFVLSTTYALANSVNYTNFATVETDLSMHRILKATGGINKWGHIRKPTPIENQQIIRMNRDTLYSLAIVDVSQGAIISVPNDEKRYISMAVINTDGYTNMVKIGGGEYELNKENVGTNHALVLMRIFIDSDNAQDVEAANKIQDSYKIVAKSQMPLPIIDWNMEEYKVVYKSLLALFKVAKNADDMFGSKQEVDYIHFLVGTAGGFGGLPSKNAVYFNYNQPQIKAKSYTISLSDVPVDAFWSFTVYNKDGYLFKSAHGLSNINSATANANADGSYTLYFGMCEEQQENCLSIEDGWNGILRLYEPQDVVINKTWAAPKLNPVQ